MSARPSSGGLQEAAARYRVKCSIIGSLLGPRFLLVVTRADVLRPPPARGHCLRTRFGKAAHALRGDSTSTFAPSWHEHRVQALSGARQWSFREAPFERRVAGA